VVLLKRAFVREGQQIPQNVRKPVEEEKEETRKREVKEREKSSSKGIKQTRGRKGGRKTKKEDDNGEEVEDGRDGEQIRVRNKEGRTKYTQAIRGSECKKKEWTKEEEEKEYQLKEIVQEIELEDDSIQYQIQFEGFTKLSDAK
jgi:hypothetical protein